MVRETRMDKSSLVYPMFVMDGENKKEEIPTMPGQFRYTLDRMPEALNELADAGVGSVMLFGIPEHKDEVGSGAYACDGIIQRALEKAKKEVPDLYYIGDVCMCEYTSHGHCGILKGEYVDNDLTLEKLAQIAVSQVQAGADMVAPSDMMDGHIRAIDLYTLSNGGAYGEHSTTTVGLSGHKAIPLYTGGCEATRFSCDVVYTNVQAAGAYRGYGATQGIFALESTVNELAEKLHMDPVELRMKNIVREGMFMPAYFGETANACALDRCIEHCADNFHWKEKYPVRDMGNGKVRASGMAIAMQGSCISNVDVGSCTLKLSDEGTYNMMIGAADMGTGCDTILAQMAAEVLDCEPDQIVVFGADTDASPYDSGSYASSTTYITGMATQNAAMELRENIMKIGAQLLECLPEEVEFDGEKVYLVNGDKSVSLADIATKSQVNNLIPVDVTATYSSPVSPPPYMVGMVEIELDKETGSVEILDYEAVVDCGIPVNPNLARVQTEGGIGQGIGMALYENVSYNANGKIAEGDFMQYKIPTRQDVGNIHVEFETSYEPSGPFGVKSIGEIVINTPAPALAHAIYRATGVWHRTVPFTPEKILMGMIDPEWKETDHRVKE